MKTPIALALLAFGLSFGAPALHATAHADETLAVSGPSRAQSPPELAGRWAQLFVTTSESRAPVIGTVESTTRTTLLADITQRGTEVTIETRVCDIRIDTNAPVDTIIPRRFIDALRPGRTTAWLAEGDQGWTITRWSMIDQVGIRLDDPARDAVPARADDPRVYDQDGDGHPGMTVSVRGLIDGEIYVVQRGWSELRDVRLAPNRIEGTISWSMEQHVLGASRWLLESQPPTWPTRDDARNYFVMTRVDDDAGCRAAETLTAQVR